MNVVTTVSGPQLGEELKTKRPYIKLSDLPIIRPELLQVLPTDSAVAQPPREETLGQDAVEKAEPAPENEATYEHGTHSIDVKWPKKILLPQHLPITTLDQLFKPKNKWDETLTLLEDDDIAFLKTSGLDDVAVILVDREMAAANMLTG